MWQSTQPPLVFPTSPISKYWPGGPMAIWTDFGIVSQCSPNEMIDQNFGKCLMSSQSGWNVEVLVQVPTKLWFAWSQWYLVGITVFKHIFAIAISICLISIILIRASYELHLFVKRIRLNVGMSTHFYMIVKWVEASWNGISPRDKK